MSQTNNEIRIKVVGVGGGGSTMVDHLLKASLPNAQYIAINTDGQALCNAKAQVKLQIGKQITNGLGAGGNPEVGRLAAESDRKKISEAISDCNVLFIVAGLGRGTGTGAAPVVADIARENGILTIAVVTTPFEFEGTSQNGRAVKGMEMLQKSVDTLTIVSNGSFTKCAENENRTLCNAFAVTDEFVVQLVNSIACGIQHETVMKAVPKKDVVSQTNHKEKKRLSFKKWLAKKLLSR